MIQLILALALIFSAGCGVKTAESFPLPEDFDQNAGVESFGSNNYSTVAEGVFGFLWPQNLSQIETPKLTKIIIAAKALQEINTSFRSENERIKNQSKTFHCLCVREGLCNDDEDPLSYPDEYNQKCEALENEKLENDKKLVITFENREALKTSVEEAGGHWLASKSSTEPALNVYLSENRFNFSDLVFKILDSDPIEVSNGEPGNSAGTFKKIPSGTFLWEGQQDSNNWKLDLQQNENFLSVQGDFFITHLGAKRRGVLGFQLIEN